MSGDAKGDTRTAQSGFRFEEIKYREFGEREQSERARESDAASQEQANGRFRELGLSARLEEKGQEFGQGAREAVQEAFGQAKEAPSKPMQRDAPAPEEIEKSKPDARQRPGGPQPAPGGTLWSHAPAARPSRGDEGPGGDVERGGAGGGAKKLEFFEDKNPDRDPDHGGPR